MRKIFVIIVCLIAMDSSFAENWWNSNFIIGAHWGPPLRYIGDSLTRDFLTLQRGGSNFVLDKMIAHDNQTIQPL